MKKRPLIARVSPEEYQLLLRLRESKPAQNPPKPRLSVGDRIADLVASTMGSWRFIIVQSILLAIWVFLNIVAFIRHWDPYPFILLNLMLSFQAAYAAPIIMMSQNRQASIDRQEAKHDYNDWYPAFYQKFPDNLELYQNLEFKTLKIGEEAIVDLKTFTLQGKPGRNLRNSINRFTKLGYQAKFYSPPIDLHLLQQLKSISDEWLQMMSGSEKQFSLGWFDESYLRECEIATIQNAASEIIAFANVVPEYQLNEITIDLMRHRSEIENGTMEFLFLSMFQYFKERGYDGFNLGLSALSGVGEIESSPQLEKALHYLYEHLKRFYNFKGLHGFKEKFHPRWESRYLVYPGSVALPDIIVALVRADSGDRLLDYFKPGS